MAVTSKYFMISPGQEKVFSVKLFCKKSARQAARIILPLEVLGSGDGIRLKRCPRPLRLCGLHASRFSFTAEAQRAQR
jgi:hypothetical protein